MGRKILFITTDQQRYDALGNKELAAAHRLYVANGDSDQVSVVDTSTNQVVSTINLATRTPTSGPTRWG